MKDPRVEKPKSRPRELKAPTPQHSTDNAETFKQAWKEKKKKRNKRDVTRKEGLRIPPQPLGPIVSALAKKEVKETARTVKT